MSVQLESILPFHFSRSSCKKKRPDNTYNNNAPPPTKRSSLRDTNKRAPSESRGEVEPTVHYDVTITRKKMFVYRDGRNGKEMAPDWNRGEIKQAMRASEAPKWTRWKIQETIGRASPRIASRLGSHFTQHRTARWLAIVRRIFYTVQRWKAIKIAGHCVASVKFKRLIVVLFSESSFEVDAFTRGG